MKPLPAVLTRPLAITADGLQLVLAVASRGDLFREAKEQALLAREGKLLENTHATTIHGPVAVIPVVGPLFRHASMLTDISGATSYGQLRKDLEAAVVNAEVKAIVLEVDSPGGEVDGVAELALAIRNCSKPVTAYVGGMGCSAAYWLASAAKDIVCAKTAELGSIGVRSAVFDDSERDAKQGVRTVEIISSQSPGKRGTPIDDEVIARAQTAVDALAEIFITDVASYRGVTTEKVKADFGGGDILIGEKAVQAGLATSIGTLEEVIAGLTAQINVAPPQQSQPLQLAAMTSPKTRKEPPMATQKTRAEALPEPTPQGEAEDTEAEATETEDGKCASCGGSGKAEDGSKCEACKGSGKAEANDGEDDKAPNEAEDAPEEAEGDDMKDEEKKEEKAALKALAAKLGLPPTASHREILLAANAGAVPMAKMEEIVAKRVEEKFAAKEKEHQKQAAAERAEKLVASAVRGGYEGDREALLAFAQLNYEGASKLVASSLERDRQLFAPMTHAGSPVGEARPQQADVQVKAYGGVKVMKHGMTLSSAAKALAKKEGISYEAALDRTVKEQPELYQSYLNQL